MATQFSYIFLMAEVFLGCILVCHSSWEEVVTLDTVGLDKVKQFISPLAGLSRNAYFYPSTQAVPNWTLASRVEQLTPVHQPGVQALVYDHAGDETKTVLAFRGTTTQADLCVDLLLFGQDGLPREIQLPSKDSCDRMFDGATLDYVTQAVNYTRAVIRAYPSGTSLLLTGHSLGAALAILVSASLSETQIIPVVAFSSPGTRKILEERSLRLLAEQKRIFVFGDEWDGVMRTSFNLQVGTVCSLEYEKPHTCAVCSSSHSPDNCKQCLSEAHDLDHFLATLDDRNTKLVCQKNFSTTRVDLPPVSSGGSWLRSNLFVVTVSVLLVWSIS